MPNENTTANMLTCKKEGSRALVLTDTESGRAFAKMLEASGFTIYDKAGKPIKLNT